MNLTGLKLQIIDLTVTIILFSIGCWVGSVVMKSGNTWIRFNAPAIGILLVGEMIWMLIRKRMVKGWVEKNDKA